VTRDLITGATDVLAIVGDPLAQASTPRLANDRLKARGIDARLMPWRVVKGEFGTVVAAMGAIRNFRGAVVTMPHKRDVCGLIDELEPHARAIGAVNVLRRSRSGRVIGGNLDGQGFVAGLARAGESVAGKRVHLIGAGGAAAAIAFALVEAGVVRLSIANRTRLAAEQLMTRLRNAHPKVDVVVDDVTGAEIFVNATSLGMRPSDPLPMDAALIEPGSLVAEVVITPAVTPFLAAAAARGCRTHAGLPMLEAQIDLMLDFMLAEDSCTEA